MDFYRTIQIEAALNYLLESAPSKSGRIQGKLKREQFYMFQKWLFVLLFYENVS
jgi:hypothetical protein